MSKFCVKTFPWHKKKKKVRERGSPCSPGSWESCLRGGKTPKGDASVQAGFSITQLQPAGLRAGLGKAGLELANLKIDEQGRAGAKLSPAKTPRSPLGALLPELNLCPGSASGRKPAPGKLVRRRFSSSISQIYPSVLLIDAPVWRIHLSSSAASSAICLGAVRRESLAPNSSQRQNRRFNTLGISVTFPETPPEHSHAHFKELGGKMETFINV